MQEWQTEQAAAQVLREWTSLAEDIGRAGTSPEANVALGVGSLVVSGAVWLAIVGAGGDSATVPGAIAAGVLLASFVALWVRLDNGAKARALQRAADVNAGRPGFAVFYREWERQLRRRQAREWEASSRTWSEGLWRDLGGLASQVGKEALRGPDQTTEEIRRVQRELQDINRKLGR